MSATNGIEGFKVLLLAEIKRVQNPLSFLRIVRADIKSSMNRNYRSKFLKSYYSLQLEVIESLILQERG